MTKLVLAAFALTLIVVGAGIAYPELFGLRYTPRVAHEPAPAATESPAHAKAGSCCGGEGDCCASKDTTKAKTGCCCDSAPKLEHIVISANSVTLMAAPQGQGVLLAPSAWMGIRQTIK